MRTDEKKEGLGGEWRGPGRRRKERLKGKGKERRRVEGKGD